MNKKKTIIVYVIILLLIIGTIVGVIVFYPSQAFKITERVVVKEGVPSPVSFTKELKVKHDGKYYLDLDWKNEPGMISGIKIIDSTGISIYTCAAEWVQIQSSSLELKKGIYEVVIFNITNEKLLQEFVLNSELAEKANEESYEPYLFVENGEFKTTYRFSLKLER